MGIETASGIDIKTIPQNIRTYFQILYMPYISDLQHKIQTLEGRLKNLEDLPQIQKLLKLEGY